MIVQICQTADQEGRGSLSKPLNSSKEEGRIIRNHVKETEAANAEYVRVAASQCHVCRRQFPAKRNPKHALESSNAMFALRLIPSPKVKSGTLGPDTGFRGSRYFDFFGQSEYLLISLVVITDVLCVFACAVDASSP